jgi:hypothetical protein
MKPILCEWQPIGTHSVRAMADAAASLVEVP